MIQNRQNGTSGREAACRFWGIFIMFLHFIFFHRILYIILRFVILINGVTNEFCCIGWCYRQNIQRGFKLLFATFCLDFAVFAEFSQIV